jgi:hypothetical protein
VAPAMAQAAAATCSQTQTTGEACSCVGVPGVEQVAPAALLRTPMQRTPDTAPPRTCCRRRCCVARGDPFVCASELAPRVDQGWEVVATATKPSLGHVGSSKIYCGACARTCSASVCPALRCTAAAARRARGAVRSLTCVVPPPPHTHTHARTRARAPLTRRSPAGRWLLWAGVQGALGGPRGGGQGD